MYLITNEYCFFMGMVACFILIYIFKFGIKLYGYYAGNKIYKMLQKDDDFLDKVKQCNTDDERKLLILQTITNKKYIKYL